MSTSARGIRRALYRLAVPSFIAWALGCCASLADDVVTLTPQAGGRGSEKLSGQVIDYGARELRLRLATGRERIVPAGEILRVETKYCDEHAAGNQLFADGDFRLAIDKYRATLETDHEVRGWVRRQVLSQIVWCWRAFGKWDQAGETFLNLLGRDPKTRYFDCIPLAWTAAAPSRDVERKAQAWLAKSEQPAAVLMGASHLLTTDRRALTLAQLKRLADHDDPRIAWLAEAQCWRDSAPRAAAQELEQFRRRIESSPQSLRAGAYFVLGSALANSQPAEAALALLKLPILYPRERALSASALLASGGCLERMGQSQQAAGLYRESLALAGSPADVDEAQKRLKNLAAEKQSR
jgi:tetratricopeptide (TPR) repeat protein